MSGNAWAEGDAGLKGRGLFCLQAAIPGDVLGNLGNFAATVNHSCRPNAELRGKRGDALEALRVSWLCFRFWNRWNRFLAFVFVVGVPWGTAWSSLIYFAFFYLLR